MSNWYLAKDGDVLKHNNKGLTVSDRIPYIDIQCPAGFNPQTEGCGKSYGSWTQINVSDNVWRFECKYSKWHDLFYNNRSSNLGDFRSTDGEFACVGSGNTDLIIYMDGLFRNCTGLVSCTTIDTSNCVNLSAMFAECSSLTAVPYLDTRQNLDFNNFVVNCTSLVSINEDIDTSNGRCFWWMCYGCNLLETVPTIDLRNATDTWQSEFARRGGNDHMFSYCYALNYIHLVGGAGIACPSGMFYDVNYQADPRLEIVWDQCNLPLVTGAVPDQGGNAAQPMFTEWPVYSISSISFPNLVDNAPYYFPKALKYGDIYMPKVVYNYTGGGWSFNFPPRVTEIGSIDFGHEQPLTMSTDLYSQMFSECASLSEFPDIMMPALGASGASNIWKMFYHAYNLGGGAYDFYLDLVSKGYGNQHWEKHYNTFTDCGINTQEGAADLARIPSDWK